MSRSAAEDGKGLGFVHAQAVTHKPAICKQRLRQALRTEQQRLGGRSLARTGGVHVADVQPERTPRNQHPRNLGRDRAQVLHPLVNVGFLAELLRASLVGADLKVRRARHDAIHRGVGKCSQHLQRVALENLIARPHERASAARNAVVSSSRQTVNSRVASAGKRASTSATCPGARARPAPPTARGG